MLESDDIWNKVRPFMNAGDDNLFVNLRDIYRGILHDCPANKSRDQSYILSFLRLVAELVGKARHYHQEHSGITKNGKENQMQLLGLLQS